MPIKLDLCNLTDQHFGSYAITYSREIKNDRICFFAAHSGFCEYPEYVFYYLEKIAAAGFGIIFISSSLIGAISLGRLQDTCSAIIEKENKGVDFGAWKIALSLTEYGKNFKSILLTNDSVIGPFFDLRPVFEKFDADNSDFYGLTSSLQRGDHIQSYFILLKYKVLTSDAWMDFWIKLICYQEKDDIIDNYEIFLTKKLCASGFQYGIWSDWQGLATPELIRKKIFKNANLFQHWGGAFLAFGDKFSKNINPCAFYWKELITLLNFPFLKRELVIYKKLNAEFDVHKNWKAAIAATGYETDLISQVVSLAGITSIIRSFPFTERKFEFHYHYDPSSPYFINFPLLFDKKSRLEKGAAASLTATNTDSGERLVFNFIYLTEEEVDSLIGNDNAGYTLLPSTGRTTDYNLILPFSDEVIPYLHNLSLPRAIIFRKFDEYETAMLRFIQQVVPGSGSWQVNHPQATLKDTIDISDLKDLATLPETPAFFPDGRPVPEPESFFELLNKYHREYDSLPMWYKKIGQVFKIMMGHKIVSIKAKNRALKISLRHKITVNENNKARYIKNWYHHEYDVLPEWYKRFGKIINKNK